MRGESIKKLTNKEQKAQAWETYQAIKVSADEAFEAIEAPAWKTYQAIKFPADKACQAIKVSAWKAYQAKCKEIDEEEHIKIIDGKRYKLMEEEV